VLLWGSVCHHVKREASQLHTIYAPPNFPFCLCWANEP
jgi:hypothetical protein